MPGQPDFVNPMDDEDDEDHPFGIPDDDGWMSVERKSGPGESDSASRKSKCSQPKIRMAIKPHARATRRRR